MTIAATNTETRTGRSGTPVRTHSLRRDEIVPGVVAVFNIALLKTHDGVKLSWLSTDTKNRPYLCLAVEGVLSWWTPLSTTPRCGRHGHYYERFPLMPHWKQGGDGTDHRHRQNYLLDTRNIAVLAARAVADITAIEYTNHTTRARITPEGVSACLKEIRANAHRRAIEIPEIPEARP